MPNIRHAFASGKSDGADATLVRASNWNAKLQYTDSTGAPSGTDAFIRETLTADRTYYVRTDGSDSNTGLVDSAGGAFLTLQHAYDVIVSTLDLGGRTVTIQTGAEAGVKTFTAGITFSQPWVGGGAVNITGDATTPSNRIISVSAKTCFDIETSLPGVLTISGFKLTGVTGSNGILVNGPGIVKAGNMNYGDFDGVHLFCDAGGGQLLTLGNYSVTGAASIHIMAEYGALLYNFTGTVTLSSASFGGSFAWCDLGGSLDSSSVTYSGTATGKRFTCNSNGVINTASGSTGFYPGTVSGTTSTGGLYL